MTFTDRVSWWTVGVRSLVAAILVAGFFFQRPSLAIFVAALAYTVAEAGRLWSVADGHRASFVEVASASGPLLRRGSLWAAIVGVILFDLLVTQTLLLALVSVVLVYVGGVFSQSARTRIR